MNEFDKIYLKEAEQIVKRGEGVSAADFLSRIEAKNIVPFNLKAQVVNAALKEARKMSSNNALEILKEAVNVAQDYAEQIGRDVSKYISPCIKRGLNSMIGEADSFLNHGDKHLIMLSKQDLKKGLEYLSADKYLPAKEKKEFQKKFQDTLEKTLKYLN